MKPIFTDSEKQKAEKYLTPPTPRLLKETGPQHGNRDQEANEMIGQKTSAPSGAPKAGGKELDAYRDYVVRIVEKEAVNGELRETVREYVTVAGRLKMFWDENEKEPQSGSIETRKVHETDTEVESVLLP